LKPTLAGAVSIPADLVCWDPWDVSCISRNAFRGHKHGNCCFCCRDLTNAVSVHLGYGPICAEKYGLPHSIETVTDNVDMNSLDALLVDE